MTLRPLPDPDGLDVAELADAVGGELAAVAGALGAAEGQLGALGTDPVDEDHSGLQPVRDPLRLSGIRGEHVGAETVRGVVGQVDRVLLVTGPVLALSRYQRAVVVTQLGAAQRLASRQSYNKPYSGDTP